MEHWCSRSWTKCSGAKSINNTWHLLSLMLWGRCCAGGFIDTDAKLETNPAKKVLSPSQRRGSGFQGLDQLAHCPNSTYTWFKSRSFWLQSPPSIIFFLSDLLKKKKKLTTSKLVYFKFFPTFFFDGYYQILEEHPNLLANEYWKWSEHSGGSETCLEPQQLVSSMRQSAWGCGLVVSHKCACSIKQNVSGPTIQEVHQCTLGSTTVLMRHRNTGVSSPPAEEADFQVFCHWKQVWAPWFQHHGGSAYRQENFLDKQREGEFSQHLRNPSWGGVCFSSLGVRGCSFPLNVHPESSLSHQADTGRPSTPNNDCSHWVPGWLLTSWPGEHRMDQLGHGQSGAGTCCEGTTRHWPRRWGLWPPDSHSCPWTSPLSFWGSGHEPEHISSCCLRTTSDILHQDHNSCHHPGDFCHQCVQLTLQL